MMAVVYRTGQRHLFIVSTNISLRFIAIRQCSTIALIAVVTVAAVIFVISA